MKEGYIYILYDDKLDKYYIGSTVHLDRREYEHLSKQSKYTKSGKNWQLVFYHKYLNIKDARRIEYKLKRFKSREIIEKIIKDGKILIK